MLEVKLKEILEERKMTQKELSIISGVPQATLSDLVRNNRATINRVHLNAIANCLEITDIKELFDFNESKSRTL